VPGAGEIHHDVTLWMWQRRSPLVGQSIGHLGLAGRNTQRSDEGMRLEGAAAATINRLAADESLAPETSQRL
jgi:hypothetical protein